MSWLRSPRCGISTRHDRKIHAPYHRSPQSPGSHQRIVARLQQAGAYSEGETFDRLDRGECSFGVDASGDVLDEFDEEEVDEIR